MVTKPELADKFWKKLCFGFLNFLAAKKDYPAMRYFTILLKLNKKSLVGGFLLKNFEVTLFVTW